MHIINMELKHSSIQRYMYSQNFRQNFQCLYYMLYSLILSLGLFRSEESVGLEEFITYRLYQYSGNITTNIKQSLHNRLRPTNTLANCIYTLRCTVYPNKHQARYRHNTTDKYQIINSVSCHVNLTMMIM